MSEIVSISSVLTELKVDLLSEPNNKNNTEKTQKLTENNMSEKEKNNYLAIKNAIGHFKKDFSFDDAVNSWHKKRKLKFRMEQDNILVCDDIVGWHHRTFYKFAPLIEAKKVNNLLLKYGFYKVPVEFKMDWQQNNFYKNLLADFLLQYIINGENNYGYYFHGNIGVGKTTLLTAIARVLEIFLIVKIRYITMTRLVRFITSIDETDKQKVADLENCDILFIDDLGIEKCTTDNQESLIRDFFAYRYGNGLTNIIAGNIDIRLQQNKNSFNRQMSDYLNDSKYYKILEICGKSKRI